MKRAMIVMFILLLHAPVLAAAASADTPSMPAKHPMEVDAPPICSQCHTDWRAAVDHTADFGGIRHRFYAQQHKQACGLCHAESFCSDCHAHKEYLKPSDKFKDSPERTLPHRGDYLNQHKIDGTINPALCMKCHGRSNNQQCSRCHK
jgi:hypothetical protein